MTFLMRRSPDYVSVQAMIQHMSQFDNINFLTFWEIPTALRIIENYNVNR